MGRNGSGKSSLLWALQGSGPRQAGSGRRRRARPGRRCPRPAARAAGRARAADADRPALPGDASPPNWRRPTASPAATDAPASARDLLDRLAPGIADEHAPARPVRGAAARAGARRSSCAPRRGSCCSTSRPAASTTRPSTRCAASSTSSPPRGTPWSSSTHDVEFVAAAADRVVVLADGEIVADGPTADVIVASPAFAPQIAKILAPLPYLTVAQVACTRWSWRRDRTAVGRRTAAVRIPRRIALTLAMAAFVGARRVPLAVPRRARQVRRAATPPPLHLRRAAAARARGGVRRDRRRRHRRQGARDARRAVRGQRRAAPARAPAPPASRRCSSCWCWPAGCSGPASASRSAARRCSRRR